MAFDFKKIGSDEVREGSLSVNFNNQSCSVNSVHFSEAFRIQLARSQTVYSQRYGNHLNATADRGLFVNCLQISLFTTETWQDLSVNLTLEPKSDTQSKSTQPAHPVQPLTGSLIESQLESQATSIDLIWIHSNRSARSTTEMNRTKATMDDLPELPFEKVLSYLSLEDRLKSRAVSRRWYHQINRFKVKTLCYSPHPAGFILGKHRLISGTFAQNFIRPTRFESFCSTFLSTILSNLKHLRLCDLRLNLSAFVSTLQSFGQLEELDIIQLACLHTYDAKVELAMPMLINIRLEKMRGLSKLTLDAPRLQKIKILSDECFQLELVHAESVKWLMAGRFIVITVKEDMKNLKVFYKSKYIRKIDPTSLSSLEQLKEIHLSNFENGLLQELFEQKQRHGRTDLMIYLGGMLLNGPDDPAIRSLRRESFFDNELNGAAFRCLAKNPSRLADKVPFVETLYYSVIERVATGTELSVLKRFIDLNKIWAFEPVEDTERFLNLLKNLDNIVNLRFECDQPQDLFNRLPDHCSALQRLNICCAPSDICFLFRLQHLTYLCASFSIDAEAIRTIIEKNAFLSSFSFYYVNKWVDIQIEHPKQFKISGDVGQRETTDLDAAIEFITGESRPKKQKIKHKV